MDRVFRMAGLAALAGVWLLGVNPCRAQVWDCAEPVATPAGLVRGAADEDTPTCSWKGIPFAAPPVGEFRWRTPQPAPAWSGVREATGYGNMCLQSLVNNFANGNVPPRYAEDCLYLNVWRPSTGSGHELAEWPQKPGPFPVMVWIHGGGYTSGAGGAPAYAGDRLAAAGDVVVVTFNYRLNVFGFLAHEKLLQEDPHGSTGNYGSLDQLAALQWVHDNIANFGGDPDQVTIFGESAGGWSVCTLLATPLAQGLFQRAILESGGCEASHTLARGFADGRAAAKKLGCGEDDVACLRKRSANQVLNRAGLNRVADYPFMPHEDGYLLTGTPLSMIQAGKFNNVPFIAGSNRDEVSKLVALARPMTYWIGPNEYAPKLHRWIEIQDATPLLDLYPLSQYQKPRYAYAQMFSDRALACPTYSGMAAVAKQQPRTYYYRFDYDGFRWGRLLGAFHSMEVPLVFNSLDRAPYSILYDLKPKQIQEAEALSRIIQGYWVHFAKTGDPNGPGLPPWPAFLPGQEMQVLNTSVGTAPAKMEARASFWADYNRSHSSLFDSAIKKMRKQ